MSRSRAQVVYSVSGWSVRKSRRMVNLTSFEVAGVQRVVGIALRVGTVVLAAVHDVASVLVEVHAIETQRCVEQVASHTLDTFGIPGRCRHGIVNREATEPP